MLFISFNSKYLICLLASCTCQLASIKVLVMKHIPFSAKTSLNCFFVFLFTMIHYAYTCTHYSPLPTKLQTNETISQFIRLVKLAYCLQMEKINLSRALLK